MQLHVLHDNYVCITGLMGDGDLCISYCSAPTKIVVFGTRYSNFCALGGTVAIISSTTPSPPPKQKNNKKGIYSASGNGLCMLAVYRTMLATGIMGVVIFLKVVRD